MDVLGYYGCNAALGGCKIIIPAPGDKEKWEK